MSNLIHQKKAEKNGKKVGKLLYRLMTNTVFGKKMENVRSRTNVRLVSNEKDYLKQTPIPCYLAQKNTSQ